MLYLWYGASQSIIKKDCYFCIPKTKGLYTKGIFKITNLTSAMRVVFHNDKLPITECPDIRRCKCTNESWWSWNLIFICYELFSWNKWRTTSDYSKTIKLSFERLEFIKKKKKLQNYLDQVWKVGFSCKKNTNISLHRGRHKK